MMTDDLKQKADVAWARFEMGGGPGKHPFLRASVEATLAAALFPVLERVARLEERVPLPFDDEDEALAGMAPKHPQNLSPAESEGSARPVCDTPGCGRPIPKGGEGYPEICPTCLACLNLHDVDSRHADAASGGTSDQCRQMQTCTLREGHAGSCVPLQSIPPAPDATQGMPQSGADGPAVTPTPCATCGGARFVCDVTGKMAPCVSLSDFYGLHANRRRCPDCSKPAASTEGEKSMPSRLESLQPKPRTTPKKFARDLKERIARAASCFEDEHTAMGVRYVLGIVDAALSDYDVRDPEDFARVGAKTWQPTAASTEAPAKHDVGPGQNLSPAESDVCEHCPNCHGERDKDGCCAGCGREFEAGTTPPAPPATQGIPQSGPQAPERIEIFMSQSLGWQISRVGGGIAYVRADVHAAAERRIGEEHAALMQERRAKESGSADATQGIPERMGRLRVVRVLETRYASASVEITMPSPQGMWPHARGTEYVRADLLASAERRIAELESKLADNPAIDAEVYAAVSRQARAEGREAGVREAAKAAATYNVEVEYRILAILDKKPEVGT